MDAAEIVQELRIELERLKLAEEYMIKLGGKTRIRIAYYSDDSPWSTLREPENFLNGLKQLPTPRMEKDPNRPFGNYVRPNYNDCEIINHAAQEILDGTDIETVLEMIDEQTKGISDSDDDDI